jgi:hypothetical protein
VCAIPAATFAIKDVTGRNDGSMNFGPGYVPGQHGNGLEVQSVEGGQRVKVPTSPSLESLSTQLTLAAWVKPAPSTQTGGAILSRQSSYALFVSSNTSTTYQIQLSTPSGGIFNSTGVIQQNQWSHVAVTVGGGRVKFYLNGQLSGDFAQMGTLTFGAPGFLFLMCHNHVGNECSAFPAGRHHR